jgi:hypothetical protein
VIASIIVFGSVAFAAGFCLAWLVRPEVRAWLETPKHRFQASVRRYDQSAVRGMDTTVRLKADTTHGQT